MDRVAAGLAIRGDERLAHQICQAPQRRPGNYFRGLAGEATTEDGEGGEHTPFILVQHRPRVVEHRTHAAMPVGHVTGLGLEEVHGAPDLGGDLVDPDRVRPRRCQQDAKWHAVHQIEDLGQRIEVVQLERERGIGPFGRIDEEADTAGVERLLWGIPSDDQPGQGEHSLAGDIELGSARGDHSDLGCCGEDL